jgi:predicted DNA-binding transcriptional regulator YafY
VKADRLLNALLLLQGHGRLTGRELATRLEVSERTVHRDMEALSASGVPIFAIRGAQGGWQLEESWRTEVPGLSESELRALLMAQPRNLGHPRLIAAAENAYNKLLASLPNNMRQQAAAMRERLHVDPTGWHVTGEDLSMLPTVQDAVARDRQLAFEYTRSDGATAPRTVDPLGLVAKGSTWYLVARAVNGLRTYRISRMQAVTVLAKNFARPSSFNLTEYWQQSTADLKQQRQSFPVTLSMDPQAAQSLAVWSKVSPAPLTSKQTPEKWVTVQVEFDSEEHARFVVLGFAARARVLAPVSLQKLVKEAASATLTLNTP